MFRQRRINAAKKALKTRKYVQVQESVQRFKE